MKIVITHLTRMSRGFCCVAGVDASTGRHIRPVLSHGQLSVSLLARNGGPFEMGAIVDLGPTRPRPSPPETEDLVFDPTQAIQTGFVTAADFWARLQAVAGTSLTTLLPDLVLVQAGASKAGVPRSAGSASLACLVPSEPPKLYLNPPRSDSAPWTIVMQVKDGTMCVNLRVTDIRLYEDDHTTPHRDRIIATSHRLNTETEVLLSVGLGRAWKDSAYGWEGHWLQVNNIHFFDNPLWKLG